jgi:hypothetical protein
MIRVAVQVLAGSVVPHRGAQVGVATSDLDIAQFNAASSTKASRQNAVPASHSFTTALSP